MFGFRAVRLPASSGSWSRFFRIRTRFRTVFHRRLLALIRPAKSFDRNS
jgi:hypothetical protein